MSYVHKTFDELNLMDDFLINAIASDPEVGIPFCRTLLSVLLQRKIGAIRVVAQRFIPAPAPGMRGVEVPSIDYQDGIHMIYFYTKGNKGGCKEIRSMLQYLQTSTKSNVSNPATQTLHDYVSRVKLDPEVRLEYMKFDDIIFFAKRDAANEATMKTALSTRVEDIYELLEDYGEIPDTLKDYLNSQTDVNTLRSWHKLAAHTKSIEDFMVRIGCDQFMIFDIRHPVFPTVSCQGAHSSV